MTDSTGTVPERETLEDMVAEADTGGRKPTGFEKKYIFAVSLAWALFQLWYASPLPYKLNFGVIADGKARIIHLSFAFLLAFATFPALKFSPRNRIPADRLDPRGARCRRGEYLLVFYDQISLRPGLPSLPDVVISVIGVVLLLEAARRAVGPALAIIATLMLVYIFAGPWLPGMMAHKGASLSRVASQMWLTSEGIFGVALGVSTNVVFFFVLFGSLLEKAGAGNYFIQLAFAMLGTFRGGPAKAGVVASGMTGMISGSSIANTVMTGTFTIPLMKRVGYSAVKAGAIEAAAGVNGQLMPPVMGAAAFLIAEYVGISYAEVVKHAFLPAFLTYGALFYIVDIEAAKLGPARPAAVLHRSHPPVIAARADDHLRHHRPERHRLLGHRLDQNGIRQRGHLDSRRSAARGLCRARPLQGEASRSRARRCHQGDHPGAGFLRDRTDRPALSAAGDRPDLVPDGGGNVARPVGLLGHAVPDFHHGDPAPADCGISRRARPDGADARRFRRSHHRACRAPRAT